MEKLIPTINKLQCVFKTVGTAGVDLPQIVVVGEQSSGKSSVLENIVGRPCLPRGIGIVTRCPIVLQLNRITANSTANDKNDVTEWAEFPHLPPGQRRVTSFEDIPNIINAEVARRAGTDRFIVPEHLIMKIYSPNVVDLTVVDLPGIVKFATEGLPEDLPEQVNNLLFQFTKNRHSIILAVSPATSDIATSASIEFARKVDPNFDRTIAVITKLDLMDAGTDARDVLNGKLLKMKLGIVGVVNRSYEDIQQRRTIEDHKEREKAFFQQHYPEMAFKQGTSYLALKLQKLLLEKIRAALTPLQSHISKELTNTEYHLASLGDDVPANKHRTMIAIMEKFCQAFKAAIKGETRNIENTVLSGGGQIRIAFEKDFPELLVSIIPRKDLSDNEIHITMCNAAPLEGIQMPLEAVYQDLARRQILRLEEPALTLAEMVHTLVLEIMENCLSRLSTDFSRFPKLRDAILVEVTKMLDEQSIDARKMLKEYVQNQASFIATNQEEFREASANAMRQCVVFKDYVPLDQLMSPGPNSEDDGSAPSQEASNAPNPYECVRTLVDKYFWIVKEPFLDYCPKVLANVVIYYLEANVHDTLISQLYSDDNVDVFMQENPITAEERLRTKEKIEQLKKANACILEVKEADL